MTMESTVPGISKPSGRQALKLVLKVLICLGGAILAVLLADLAQRLHPTQFIIVGLGLVGWLAYSLFFGFGFEAAVSWCLLFLIKPMPATFYGLLLSLAAYLLALFYQGKLSRLVLPHPLLIILLLGTSIQALLRAASFTDAFSYFCSTALVPLLILTYFTNSRVSWTMLLSWLKLAVYISAGLGVIGVVMGILNPAERLGSLWITAMTINGFYTITFFFALGLVMNEEKPVPKLRWSVMALFIFLGMMYTYTRMALVAVIFGLGLIMWRIKRFRLVGIITLGLVPLLIPASMVLRFQAGFQLDESMFIRFLAWYFSLGQILNNFWFGIGISTWKTWYAGVVPMRQFYAEHPHNLWLKIWVEIGVFGLLAYFALIGKIMRRFWRNCVKTSDSQLAYMVFLGALALLFSCLTDIFIQQYSVSIIFWLTMGFMLSLSKPQIEEQ